MSSGSREYVPKTEEVDGAIRQAAEKVLKRAKQTETPVVVWEDGEIKEIPPEEIEMRMKAEKLPSPPLHFESEHIL
jgi:hypothetical protein